MSPLHGAGFEQTCRACGRWEAAGSYCSWCLAPILEADWYPNGDLEARRSRMPTSAPVAPPPEYRNAEANWPATWGRYPRQKPPRQPRTPPKRPFDGSLGL